MRLLSFLFLFYCGLTLQAQSPTITASQETTLSGSEVTVFVSVDSFIDAVSVQFTLNWDASILSYQTTGNYGLPGLSEFNFGDIQTNEGQLTFVWFDGLVNGVTLDDGTIIFSITFDVVGQLGEQSVIQFGNSPTPIQVGVLDGVDISEIQGIFIDGQVDIISNILSLSSHLDHNDCFNTNTGSIDLTINGGILPYTYNWTGPNNFSSADTSLANLAAGEYFITVTDPANFSVIDTFTITQPSPITITDLTIEPSHCDQNSGSINLTTSGGTPDYLYNFGDGFITQSSIIDLPSDTYMVYIQDANQCEIDTLITVTETDAPTINLGEDMDICPKTTIALMADMGFTSYEWFFEDQPIGGNDAELEISEQGTYSILITDNNGCTAADTVLITVLEPELNAGPDTTIIAGDSLQLFALGGTSYQWSTAIDLSCYDCPAPSTTLTESTTFQVLITSEEGCTEELFFTVEVSDAPELLVELVNYMSPNGDGKNDVLIFRGLENYKTSQLSIFNRWGDLLFNKLNYQADEVYWDATYKNQDLAPGIYYYVLRLDTISDPIRSGLTIVRD